MSVTTINYPLSYWESIESRLAESIGLLQDKVATLLEPLETKVDMKDAMLAKAGWRRQQISALLAEIRSTGFLKFEVSMQLHQGKAAAGLHSLGLKAEVLSVFIRNQEILLDKLGERETQEAQLEEIKEKLAQIKGAGDAISQEKARWRDVTVRLDILGEIDLPGGNSQLQKLRMDLSNIELQAQQIRVSSPLAMTITTDLWPTLAKLGVDEAAQEAVDEPSLAE